MNDCKWTIQYYPNEIGISMSNCYSYVISDNSVKVTNEGLSTLEAKQKVVKYYRDTADFYDSLDEDKFLYFMNNYSPKGIK